MRRFVLLTLLTPFSLAALGDTDAATRLSRDFVAVDRNLTEPQTKELVYGLAAQERLSQGNRYVGELVIYTTFLQAHKNEPVPSNTYQAIVREEALIRELNLVRDRYDVKAKVLENHANYKLPNEFEYVAAAVEAVGDSFGQVPGGKGIWGGTKILTSIARDQLTEGMGASEKDHLQQKVFHLVNQTSVNQITTELFQESEKGTMAGRVIDHTYNVDIVATHGQKIEDMVASHEGAAKSLVLRSIWKDVRTNLKANHELTVKVDELGKIVETAFKEGADRVIASVADLKTTYQSDRQKDAEANNEQVGESVAQAAYFGMANTVALYVGVVSPQGGHWASGIVAGTAKIYNGIEAYKLGTKLKLSKLTNVMNLVSSIADGLGMILSLFGGPSEMEIVLEQLHRMQDQIADLRNTMLDRFDSVDRQLGAIFKLLGEHAGDTKARLIEIQKQMSGVHMQLLGLDRKMDSLWDAIQKMGVDNRRNDVDFHAQNCIDWNLKTGQPMSDEMYHQCLNFLSWCASHGNKTFSTPASRDLGMANLEENILTANLGAGNFAEHLTLIAQYQQQIRGQAFTSLPEGNHEIYALCGSAYLETLEVRPDLAAKQTDFSLTQIKNRGRYLLSWMNFLGAAPNPLAEQGKPHQVLEPLLSKYSAELLNLLADLHREELKFMNSEVPLQANYGDRSDTLFFNHFDPRNGSLDAKPEVESQIPVLPEEIGICDEYGSNPHSPQPAGRAGQVKLPLPRTLPFYEHLTSLVPLWVENANRMWQLDKQRMGAKLELCYDDVHFEVGRRDLVRLEDIPEIGKNEIFTGLKLSGPLSFSILITLHQPGQPPRKLREIRMMVDRFIPFGLDGFKGLGLKERLYNVNAWMNEGHEKDESRFDRELQQAWQIAILKRRQLWFGYWPVEGDPLNILLRTSGTALEWPETPVVRNPQAIDQRRETRKERHREIQDRTGRDFSEPTMERPQWDASGLASLRETIAKELEWQRNVLLQYLIYQLRNNGFAHSKSLDAARRVLEATVSLALPYSLVNQDALHAVFFGKYRLPDTHALADTLEQWQVGHDPKATTDPFHLEGDYIFRTSPEGVSWEVANEGIRFTAGASFKALSRCSKNPAAHFHVLPRWVASAQLPNEKGLRYSKPDLLFGLGLYSQIASLEASQCLNDLLDRPNTIETQPLMERVFFELGARAENP
jgi:hypothetical protein